jgi:hypothetical protein
MKFKNALTISVLFVAAIYAEVAETPVQSLAKAERNPETVGDAPVPRELEAKNTNVDMTQFEQLRLRHSIKLLPGAKKSVKGVHGKGLGRKLDGSSEENLLPEPVKNALKDMVVDAIKSQATSETPEAITAAPQNLANAPQESEEAFYEDGTGLFIAQEQKRILLLQFYEVILNNPKRTPQVDPRIIKLMTNYLQTLEYVYVKQIQHHEESPPVLYNYLADNETASFCDSPPTSLPDQKFLNEDDDYFVKLFDQYNQQQLGVYMSPTQLKQQGLYRKLARHLAEAQVSEDQRLEAQKMFRKTPKVTESLAVEDEIPRERNLKAADKKEKKEAKGVNPDAPEDASKNVPTHFKVIKPSKIDLESDFDTFAPPKSQTKKSRKLKRSLVTPAPAETVDVTKRQLKTRRVPVRENVDGEFPAPIDDPFPIKNANVFRENIVDDSMEILDFFSRQLNTIFERMERLNTANRGLTRWRIKPHWRDFEQAVQYFQALASRSNRINDVIELVIQGCGDKHGVGFMGNIFGETDRLQLLNRRLANLNSASSTANIHLRNMNHNLHQMRASMASVPPQRRNALNHQLAAQQMAINRQQNMVNDLRARVNRGHQYHREANELSRWFNGLGNMVAKEASKVRLDYIRLEMSARNLLHATSIDMTQPRNQRMNLRFFEAAIPRMIVSKNRINHGIRRLLPRMETLINAKERVKGFVDRWVRDLHRRVRVRKLKVDETGKGLI